MYQHISTSCQFSHNYCNNFFVSFVLVYRHCNLTTEKVHLSFWNRDWNKTGYVCYLFILFFHSMCVNSKAYVLFNNIFRSRSTFNCWMGYNINYHTRCVLFFLWTYIKVSTGILQDFNYCKQCFIFVQSWVIN